MMKGKICMVTGATSGVGQETALALARQGATVIVVGRNPERCTATVNRIKRETGNDAVESMPADLSSQVQIHQLVEAFQRRHPRLDVLVNNAGAFFLRRKLSVDGLEMTFALNHLNYFLLTNLLLDTLKASAPARIVNVASSAHNDGRINFSDLQLKRWYTGWRAYAQSKLGNVLFTYELARRLDGTGITANAAHPGFVATNLGKNNGWLARLLIPVIFRKAKSPAEGAETVIHLASSPDVEEVTGEYFVKRRTARSSPASYDQKTGHRLWEVSAKLTGL